MPEEANKARQRAEQPPEQLYLDLDGFEGPLDVLLHLVQVKKLDLGKISVLALADQYLCFIEQAQALQLELAGEYLLMAARLIYIKSRLLLPQMEEESDEGRESAEYLQFRLARLAAMREVAEKLFHRALLGEAVFARGETEEARLHITNIYEESLYAVLTAYANVQKRRYGRPLRMGEKRNFWSLEQARRALSRMLLRVPQGDWLDLGQSFAGMIADRPGGGQKLQREAQDSEELRSALAGSFVAGLELAREGKVELRQGQAFTPLYLRAKVGKAV